MEPAFLGNETKAMATLGRLSQTKGSLIASLRLKFSSTSSF